MMPTLRIGRALRAGAVGALAALAVEAAAWWLLRFDPGVRRVLRDGVLAVAPRLWWLAAAAALIAGGAVLAVAYALVFEYVTRRASWWIGAVAGLAHGVALWLTIGMAAWRFPEAGVRFASELSALFDSVLLPAGVVAAHGVFGAVVGTLYGRTRHRAAAVTRVSWREVYPTEQRFDQRFDQRVEEG